MLNVKCRVCNTLRDITQIKSDGEWECQTCGNLLGADGHIRPS